MIGPSSGGNSENTGNPEKAGKQNQKFLGHNDKHKAKVEPGATREEEKEDGVPESCLARSWWRLLAAVEVQPVRGLLPPLTLSLPLFSHLSFPPEGVAETLATSTTASTAVRRPSPLFFFLFKVGPSSLALKSPR